MKRNKKPKHSLRLTVIFSVTFTAIMSVTTILVMVLVRLLFLSPVFGKQHIPSHTVTIIFALMSVAVGTLLSLVFSRIVIQPLDELIKALARVTERDYTAKVVPSGIKRSKHLGMRFNRMTEELQGITMLNEDFVNNFSHEFKTPITSIHGFAKLIRTGEIPPEKEAEYLDIIIGESERLAQLSNNVLLLSKMEKHIMVGEPAPVNVTEQLRRTVAMLENRWNAKNILPSLDGEEHSVLGYPDLLSHVWVNILDNAIKFTGENGEIRIGVSESGGNVTVRIEDTGSGMDEETVKNIFNKFYQGDRSHSTVGSGLGMAIAEKAVRLHNGTIRVKSEIGRGTAVTVTLPEKPEE